MSISPEKHEAIEKEIAYRDGKESKTFDWIKAVSILKANNIKNAGAGLIEDWHSTSGTIFECGDVCKESGAFFQSIWATPGLLVEYGDGKGEMIECWCYVEDATWDADEIWPEIAVTEFLNRPHFVVDELGNKIELW